MPSDLADSDLTLSQPDREKLGPLISVHPPASRMHKVNIAIASTFTVLFGVPAVWLLVVYLRGGPGNGAWIGAAVFGPLALATGFGAFSLIRKLGWKLYLYASGFVWQRGRTVVVTWDEVKSTIAQQDVMGGRKLDFWFRFILHDGTKFTIDSSYRDFDAFVAAALEGVDSALLRRAEAAFQSGDGIPFGKTVVTPNGLEREGQFLAWADVEKVTVETAGPNDMADSVIVYQRGKTGKAARWWVRLTTEFHNLDTFLTLCRRFTAVELPEG